MVLLLGFSLAPAPGAAQDIEILGLFKDRAILSINGTQRILKVGEPVSAEGIRLISADSREAVLEIHNVQRSYALGAHISSSQKQQPIVRIEPDRQGHYLYGGKINGHAVEFVVDTGASLVSMSRREATRLQLKYREGRPSLSRTASGIARIYVLRLEKVSLGAIELHGIQAAVHESDDFPPLILLGNSFLEHLSLQREGTLLELKKKH